MSGGSGGVGGKALSTNGGKVADLEGVLDGERLSILLRCDAGDCTPFRFFQ